MNKPHLIAVGSSALVAREIADIASALLGPSLPIETTLTTAIEAPAPDTFYICAVTQEDRLRRVLPAAQLYVFDLHPTTRFFLDIAKIPAGETVCVFNNLRPYAELLIEECHELGIKELHFRPLAFEEMALPALLGELEQARWLIGVEPFVGKDLLLAPPYREHLRPDLTIIPGHRTASVTSACQLLTSLAEYHQLHLRQEYQALRVTAEQMPKRLLALAREIEEITHLLQHASLEAIKQQIGTAAAPDAGEVSDSLSEETRADELCTLIEDRFATLAYLTDRLRRLSKPPEQ